MASPSTRASLKAVKRRAPLDRTSLSEIVHIRVGPELKDFGVHKDLIYHYSPYFKAVFNSGFEETKTGVMNLAETGVKPFELFVSWLYTQSVWNNSDHEETWPDIDDLVKLYILADMAQVPSLMNQTLDAMQDISDLKTDFPSVGVLAFIWNYTLDTSQLRRLVIDWIVWNVDEFSIYADWVSELPNNCILEVLKAAGKITKRYRQTDEGYNANPLLTMTNYHVPENAGKDSS
ncbi:hypothetical protein ONS95_011515 [Cadophora gregata]|uniref:uncharacterized protein n=1 Tax=Cadophora gregata TaxID=51156 RepID=UPI0026DC7297|nr:uncharacterized protein ONS95_011515 [Cadophora gregata]KAK0120105.1 hypothetical protein ONS95_011515 [Cadophora gregata]KAK0121133.1 hypothetical protein ONS96_011314 [Cadophora gregata f. sp. sojae]